MKDLFHKQTSTRLRKLLAACYTLFIVYASLTPFTGWREQGLNFIDVLLAPPGLTYTLFDTVVNFLAYLPFGLLTGLILRTYFGTWTSVILGSCVGVLLSGSMEFLQMYLPSRTSSNVDILSNGTGTVAGTLVSLRLATWEMGTSWIMHWRRSLFQHGKEADFALMLIALWGFAQINPSLPMLGNVFIAELARQPFVAPPPSIFDWWQSGAVALNLLMLGTLLLTLLSHPHHTVSATVIVLCLVALVKFIAAAILLKSWALLLWINSEAMLGILAGMSVLYAVIRLPRFAVLFIGTLSATTYLVIMNLVLDYSTPAASMSIYHWHYRHLLNYNGLAQTILLCFPALLIFHLWRVRKV